MVGAVVAAVVACVAGVVVTAVVVCIFISPVPRHQAVRHACFLCVLIAVFAIVLSLKIILERCPDSSPPFQESR